MTPELAVPVAVFLLVASTSLLALRVASGRRRELRRRLDPASAAGHQPKRAAEPVRVLKETQRSSSLIERMPAARSATVELRRANMTVKVPVYLLGRLLAAVAGGGLVWLISESPIFSVLAGLGGWLVPRFVVKRSGAKRTAAFEAQLAEALDLMGGALQAGHGFLQAIDACASEMADPMKEELRRVIDRVNVGGNAGDALQELTTRIDSYDVQLMASAIAVQRQSGGNLAEILSKLSHTVRERRRIRGEVKALTGGARMSSYIVGVIPFGLTAYFAAVSADFRATMFGTTMGNIILGFAAVWTLIGFFLSQRVASVEY